MTIEAAEYKTELDEKIDLVMQQVSSILRDGPREYARFCVICGARFVTQNPGEVACSEQCEHVLDQEIAAEVAAIFSAAVPRALEVAQEAARDESVYFVQGQESGRIKIGYSANLDERVAALQVSSAEPLLLLCSVHGDRRLEAMLHERFAQHRERGEWFVPDPELLEFVEEIKSRQWTPTAP